MTLADEIIETLSLGPGFLPLPFLDDDVVTEAVSVLLAWFHSALPTAARGQANHSKVRNETRGNKYLGVWGQVGEPETVLLGVGDTTAPPSGPLRAHHSM